MSHPGREPLAPPRRRARLLACGLALLLGAAPAAAVDAAAPPSAAPSRRVISLNPSLTAILVALGARDALVGVDDFSAREIPEVAALPRVGGLYNPSLEAVIGLHPDLVVVVTSAEQRDFRARLAELDVPVLVLAPVSFDDVLESIRELGARVGREAAAARRIAEIRRVRAAVEAAVAGAPRVRTVLVLQRDPLFVVGRGSFVDEMLQAAGGINLADAFPSPYPRVAREWLIEAAPQVLLDASDEPQPARAFWSQWPSLPAVAADRVVSLTAGLVTLPGPDLDRALLALARALHGPQLLPGEKG